MISKRRLLILSCSQRKRTSSGLLPAIERYNGPVFFVLRRFLRERPNEANLLDVYILSAAKGLIPADQPIENYDRIMNRLRADELQPEVLNVFAEIVRNDYASLFLVMGKVYLAVFSGWQDLVPANLSWMVAEGPMGIKQAQLKNWLWESPVNVNNGENQ